ncbi:MAG: hypothetical protein JRD68_14700, partial [Deltaproteobacteria bacterium]|nr:hypothetical protein [Deltaproteobacteria bacterium]
MAHYKLNGDLTDSSGGGYGGTGTMEHGSAVYVAGPPGYGQALKCDPDDGDGWDKVAFSLDALRQCSRQITVALWQYGDPSWDGQNEYNCIFQAYNDDDSDHIAGVYGLLNSHLPFMGQVSFAASGGNPDDYEHVVQENSDPCEYQGQWNHWVFTKDIDEDMGEGITGSMRMYLNGQLWAEWSDFDSAVFVDEGAWGLGFGAGVGGGGP